MFLSVLSILASAIDDIVTSKMKENLIYSACISEQNQSTVLFYRNKGDVDFVMLISFSTSLVIDVIDCTIESF